MKKLIIMLGIVFILSGSAYGATVSEDCGCGLGRVAIGEKTGLGWNLLGTFLNGISGNQTFGMTSGTLDCGGGGMMMGANEKLELFVADNMDALAVDIASGGGETLDALAELAGLAHDKSELTGMLQAQFDAIYPDARVTHTHVSQSIQEIIAHI